MTTIIRPPAVSTTPTDLDLLLPELRRIPGIDMAARHLPAAGGTAVVGDFYDVFGSARANRGIVIGDVCGTGVEAAEVALVAREILNSAVMRYSTPSRVLTALNQALLSRNRDEGDPLDVRFLTALYISLTQTPASVAMTLCSAGHPPALLCTADGLVSEIGHTGSIIGVFPSAELGLRETRIRLLPGDTLLLYTDGVTEARRRQEFYGTERLGHLLHTSRGLDAEELSACIMQAVVAFSAGELRDDTSVLVLRVPLRRPAEAAALVGSQRTVESH